MLRVMHSFILQFGPVGGEIDVSEMGVLSPDVSKSWVTDLRKRLESYFKRKNMLYETSYYGSPVGMQAPNLGSRQHIRDFIDDLLVLANDVYNDLSVRCRNGWQNIDQMHIIGHQTGVYLALQVLRFYVTRRISQRSVFLDLDYDGFVSEWAEFLTTVRTREENEAFARLTAKVHISFVAVDPMLPRYTGWFPRLLRYRVFNFPLPSLEESPDLAKRTVIIAHDEVQNSSKVEEGMMKELWECSAVHRFSFDQNEESVLSSVLSLILPQESSPDDTLMQGVNDRTSQV